MQCLIIKAMQFSPCSLNTCCWSPMGPCKNSEPPETAMIWVSPNHDKRPCLGFLVTASTEPSFQVILAQVPDMRLKKLPDDSSSHLYSSLHNWGLRHCDVRQAILLSSEFLVYRIHELNKMVYATRFWGGLLGSKRSLEQWHPLF